MQYNSWLYLLPFLGCSVLLYYILPLKHQWKVLLGASLFFYVLGGHLLIGYAMFSTVTIYFAALQIEKGKQNFKAIRKQLEKAERKVYKAKMEKKEKQWIALICIINLGILFFCKYFNFAGVNLNLLFEKLHLAIQIPKLDLLIPLGISFYTMAAISYVTDVARGMCPAEKNYGKLLLFLIFFPAITEGPIEKYGHLGQQFNKEHPFNYREFCFGCQLILWGLFQKVVLADRLNVLISLVFSNSKRYAGLPVILAMLFYTFQLYMDFAGCINIARGSAELFGINLVENFRQPFFSTSVNEFWRRWHMSLGTWFKDYIFYPVSLSKPFQNLSKYCRNHMPRYYASTVPAIFALFCVWISTGIWHGAEWKYVVYGLYYYCIMVIGMLLEPAFAKFFESIKVNRKGKVYRLLQQLRTFLLVNIGMVIFRADNLTIAFRMLRAAVQPHTMKMGLFEWLLNRGGLHKIDLLVMFASIIFLIIYGRYKENGGQFRVLLEKQALPIRWAIYLGVIVVIIAYGAYGPGFGVADFIYAQF